MFKRNDAAI